MSLIKEPDIDPGAMHLICRLLLEEKEGLTEVGIIKRIAPANLDHDEYQNERGSKRVSKTIKEMPEMKILEKTGSDVYTLTKPFRNHFKTLNELTSKAFSNYLVTKTLTDESLISNKASNCYELAHALARVMNVPEPFNIKWDDHEYKRMFAPHVVNSTQWVPFSRWLCFLGFAKPHLQATTLMLNTGEILEPFVLDVLGAKTSVLKMEDFLSALGKKFPISDRGSVGSEVESPSNGTKTNNENKLLSKGLSLALLVLDQKKIIEISRPVSDDKRTQFQLSEFGEFSDLKLTDLNLVGIKAGKA